MGPPELDWGDDGGRWEPGPAWLEAAACSLVAALAAAVAWWLM